MAQRVKEIWTNRLRWVYLMMILGHRKFFLAPRIFYGRRIFYECRSRAKNRHFWANFGIFQSQKNAKNWFLQKVIYDDFYDVRAQTVLFWDILNMFWRTTTPRLYIWDLRQLFSPTSAKMLEDSHFPVKVAFSVVFHIIYFKKLPDPFLDLKRCILGVIWMFQVCFWYCCYIETHIHDF